MRAVPRHRPVRSVRSFLACAAFAAALPASAMPADELYRLLSPSVWQVVTFDAARKPLASGSAVVVGVDTLVTNCHVLRSAAAVSLRRAGATRAARLKDADVERDLCTLSSDGLEARAVPLHTATPAVGMRVYTIGSPRGLEATLSDGLVSGLRTSAAGELEYVQISAPISPGSSGGGLFDEEGRLLGITTSGVAGNAQNLNFARPAWMIPELPQRAAAALGRWRDAAGPSKTAIVPPNAAAASVPSPAGTAAAQVPAPTRTPGGAVTVALGDAGAIPYVGEAARDEYRQWLGWRLPRAFAIAPTGHWAATHGERPPYPGPTDPSARALEVCQQRSAGVPCRLYAVNTEVVWDFANAPPAQVPHSAATSGQLQPRPIASGYAALDDVDAVPYLSDRGRRGYLEYVTWPTPKAFALASNGYWFSAWGLRPKDTSMPTDPSERALLGCSRAAGMPCRLYAVNGSVVWRRDESPALTSGSR